MIEASSLMLRDFPRSSNPMRYLDRADKRGQRRVHRKRMLTKLRLDAAMPEIIKKYLAGSTHTALAKEYQCGGTTIRRRLKKAKVHRSKVPNKPKACIRCGKSCYGTSSTSKYCAWHRRVSAAESSKRYYHRWIKKSRRVSAHTS